MTIYIALATHLRALAAALLAGAILTSSASAQEIKTAGDLVRLCKAAEGDRFSDLETGYNRGKCWGYLQGVMDGFGFFEQKMICIPTGVTFEQIRLVFLKWATDRPAELHQSASFSYAAALVGAFPCPTTPKPKK